MAVDHISASYCFQGSFSFFYSLPNIHLHFFFFFLLIFFFYLTLIISVIKILLDFSLKETVFYSISTLLVLFCFDQFFVRIGEFTGLTPLIFSVSHIIVGLQIMRFIIITRLANVYFQ